MEGPRSLPACTKAVAVRPSRKTPPPSLMAHLDFEKPLVDLESKINELKQVSNGDNRIHREIATLERRAKQLQHDLYRELTTWQKVQLSRHPDRPYFLDYLERLFDDFVELHGDRAYGDDPAVVAGFASFEGQSVALIGQQKGRTTKRQAPPQLRNGSSRGLPKSVPRDGNWRIDFVDPCLLSSTLRAPTRESAPRNAAKAKRSVRRS